MKMQSRRLLDIMYSLTLKNVRLVTMQITICNFISHILYIYMCVCVCIYIYIYILFKLNLYLKVIQ